METLKRRARKAGLSVRFARHEDLIGESLAAVLDGIGVARIVVAGIPTETVAATCRGAVLLGYDVILVADAHSPSDRPDPLDVQQIIAHHNETLRSFRGDRAGVTVLPAEEVMCWF